MTQVKFIGASYEVHSAGAGVTGLSDMGSTGDMGRRGPGVVGRIGTMEAGGGSSRNGVTSRGFLSLLNRLGAIFKKDFQYTNHLKLTKSSNVESDPT